MPQLDHMVLHSCCRVHFDSQQPDSPLVDAVKAVMTPLPSGSMLQLLNILVPELKYVSHAPRPFILCNLSVGIKFSGFFMYVSP